MVCLAKGAALPVAVLFLVLLCIDTGQAGWGPWSPWSACSATCGNGVQLRIRHCTDDHLKCPFANQTEEYQCDSGKMCAKVDGGWSSWGDWTNCTRRCGTGFHERWRKCNNPEPKYGGKMCNGSQQEGAPCVNPACPPLYFGEDKAECGEGRVLCADGKSCVWEFRRCDFRLDCPDGSDESACREGEPVEIYDMNTANGLGTCSAILPLLISGLALWMTNPQGSS